jgi:hypothetical protein
MSQRDDRKAMPASDALRQKRCRDRRRKGLVPVQVLVSQQEIDFLVRAYELTLGDKASIGHAVEAFLSDKVLEDDALGFQPAAT